MFSINCRDLPNLMDICEQFFKVIGKKFWLTFCGHSVYLDIGIVVYVAAAVLMT